MIDEKKNKLGSSGEPAKFLIYDDYKGYKLSVKPESANYVCNYLRNDVSIQLEDMLEMVNAAYKDVTECAGKTYVLPASFDKTQAVKAIIRAIDCCTNAASQVYNLSDAICKYGSGGWLSEQSIFEHLNEFISSSNVPNNINTSVVMSPTEVIGADVGGNIVEGADSKTDYILDIASNEIFISTKSDVIFDFSSCVVDSFSSITETIFREMTTGPVSDNSDSDVSNSLVHQLLGSAGLAAASAVALGGKILYDKKKEETISEMKKSEEDDDDDDETEENEDQDEKFLYSRNLNTELSDATWRSKANVVEMKKELFNIGQELTEEEAMQLKKELFGVPESKNKVTNVVSPDKLRKEIYSYVKDATPTKEEVMDMKKELFGIGEDEGFSKDDILNMKKELFGINDDEDEFSKKEIIDMKKDLFGIGEDGDI